MDLDHFQYLALLLATVAVTLPLEFFYVFRVWRAPLRLLKAVGPVAAIFVAWDLVSISRDLWSFNERFVAGPFLLGLIPLDELAFFLIVPVAGLSGFEAVCAQLRRWGIEPLRMEPQRGRQDA